MSLLNIGKIARKNFMKKVLLSFVLLSSTAAFAKESYRCEIDVRYGEKRINLGDFSAKNVVVNEGDSRVQAKTGNGERILLVSFTKYSQGSGLFQRAITVEMDKKVEPNQIEFASVLTSAVISVSAPKVILGSSHFGEASKTDAGTIQLDCEKL